eukprot:Skav224759  [mRNA]  locus=scaffold1604:115746:119186:- [translate_table: standard]
MKRMPSSCLKMPKLSVMYSDRLTKGKDFMKDGNFAARNSFADLKKRKRRKDRLARIRDGRDGIESMMASVHSNRRRIRSAMNHVLT